MTRAEEVVKRLRPVAWAAPADVGKTFYSVYGERTALYTVGMVREDEAACLIESLVHDIDEARRRRDEWRKKAEGFDSIRLALREKVGAPWPPNLSRALWAGIAADEKARADAAEAQVSRLTEALEKISRMHTVLDDKTNTFTLAMAHVVATKALNHTDGDA